MTVPLYALPGFNLDAERRYVAAHYKIRPRTLERRDGRHGDGVAEARHALMFSLVKVRGLEPGVAARLMRCSKQAILNGVQTHQERIDTFRLLHQIKVA